MATLTLLDFEDLLAAAGDTLPLIGGQAVAWWAMRFHDDLPPDISKPLTSRAIDFWADREQMDSYARAIRATPRYPHHYEMTVLAGVIPVRVNGSETSIEFLHTVPGLDISDPEAATVVQTMSEKRFRILDPVSLVCAKLHALRNFSQDGRQDLFHLRVCLATSRPFIDDAFQQFPRTGLWYCERLIKVCLRQNNNKLLQKSDIDWRPAIPVETVKCAASDDSIPESDRIRMQNFIEQRWSRISQ